VKDSATGEAMSYTLLDEMPAHHREVFVRTLKFAGLRRGED
jgi:hypothetical protein